ncbi:MAG: transposase [Saprospirales bacterium]|nr:transposase [Saprospirales bacterium]
MLRVILTDKYLDHLPLYRISARFERLGMVIPRSTLCGWVAQCAKRLGILYVSPHWTPSMKVGSR